MDKITQQLKRRFSSRGQSFSDELLSTLVSRVIKDTPDLDIAALTRGEPSAQNALLAAIASPAEKSFTRTVTLEQSVAAEGSIDLALQAKDGDWIAINDGDVTKVFEYDEGSKASGILGFSSQPSDTNTFTLNDGSVSKVFEFDYGREGQVSTGAVLTFSGVPADNSRITMYRANGVAVVFQFKKSGLADSGNKIVRCNVATKEQAARELIAAINSVGNYAANRVNGFHAFEYAPGIVHIDRTEFGGSNTSIILGQTQVETTTAVGTITQAGDLAVTVTGDGITGSPLAVPVAVSAGTKQKETATVVGTITAGVKQVETATADGTVTVSGDAEVIVTADGLANSPKTISVAVLENDTASDVGGKIRAALEIDSDITDFFDISGEGADVVLTAKVEAANDETMNISIDNDTCEGITPDLTSANTTEGVAPGTGDASVVVTAAGMTNSPKTVSVAVEAGDDASVVGGKIRTALGDDSDVSDFFTVSGAGASVVLEAKIVAANDATMNIAIDNDTCSGLTTAPTSSNTTSGVVADTAAVWAEKVRTALGSESAITDLYDVGGVGTQIILTRNTAEANDSTLNIALANGTAAGITPDPRSTNTRKGISSGNANISLDQNFHGGQTEIVRGTGITAGRVGVAVGESLPDTVQNLVDAINGVAGFGMGAEFVDYNQAKVFAKVPGTAGNSMTLAKSGAALSVSGGNLTGGADAGSGGVQEGRIPVAIGATANLSATALHTAINAESEDFSITSDNSAPGICALTNTQEKGAAGNQAITFDGECFLVEGMSGGKDTSATIVSDEEVGPGRKVFVTGFHAVVQTANWEDTNQVLLTNFMNATEFIALPVSVLQTDTLITPSTEDVVLQDPFLLGEGGSEGFGLKALAAGNELTGGPLTITVSGTIKKA